MKTGNPNKKERTKIIKRVYPNKKCVPELKTWGSQITNCVPKCTYCNPKSFVFNEHGVRNCDTNLPP